MDHEIFSFQRNLVRHDRNKIIKLCDGNWTLINSNVLARTKRNKKEAPDPGKGSDQQ